MIGIDRDKEILGMSNDKRKMWEDRQQLSVHHGKFSQMESIVKNLGYSFIPFVYTRHLTSKGGRRISVDHILGPGSVLVSVRRSTQRILL